MILCVFRRLIEDKVYISKVQAKINNAAAGSEVEEEELTVGGNVKL